jgi:hypothetical protein
MTTEITPKEILRIEQILTVMNWMKIGDDLGTALTRVGISKATYYRWFAKGIEARDLLAQAKQELEMIEYADIVISKGEVLRTLISDALDKNTFASDRLAILQYLDSKLDHLSNVHRASDTSADFLQGINLEPGISSHRDVTIEVGGVKINISGKSGEILESQFEEDE